jgi:diaminopimelate decarboxylase
MAIVKLALSKPHLHLSGFHCHIGSQIFDTHPFSEAADIMVRFIASVKDECGVEVEELNLGGGLGVPYTEYDRPVDYAAAIKDMADIVHSFCDAHGVGMPKVILEPGRSLVAAAGITLYTVGSVKEIPGFRTYVSVDGGMPDNPRYALYQSTYTALIANRPNEPRDCRVTIAGRCCESGDLLGEDMPLQTARRGDILAVLTTGAYNFAMASNYNRLPRPPVILVKDGQARVAVKRETYEDLIRNDIF